MGLCVLWVKCVLEIRGREAEKGIRDDVGDVGEAGSPFPHHLLPTVGTSTQRIPKQGMEQRRGGTTGYK